LIFHSISKRPVLIAGSGVRAADAAGALLEFAKKTDIPVVTTMNSVDLIQDDLRLGFIGTYGNRVANMIVEQSDFVISIGARLGLRQIGHVRERFAPNAKLIRCDVDQYELSRNVKDDEEKYLVDAKDFIEKLIAEDIPKYTGWKKKCFEAKKELSVFDNEIGNNVMAKISSMLPKDPIVAIDVGQNECWAAQSLSLKGEKGRIMISGGYASMGCGLPFAVGASIAIGKKTVYCLTGDGGLQMNIQELQTIVHEKLPVKIIVINNHTLGKISEIQIKSYDRRFCITTEDSGYSVPDFEKIAVAYGIKAKTLKSYTELDDCEKWLFDNESCLINITLPMDCLLIPKVDWNTGVIKPDIDEKIQRKIESILCSC